MQNGRACLSMILLTVGGLFAASAHGQAYDRIAPKTLPGNEPAAVPGPPTISMVPTSDHVVLEVLKGLVFVPDAGALKKSGVPADAAGPTGIAAPGLPLLADPAFTAKVTAYLGHRLTLADLDGITKAVSDWYREHDQPFMSVTAPPQNISTGVVQIVVSQYRVGTVTADGNQYFSSDLLIGESGLAHGDPLTLSGIQQDLDWLNGNPFRTVKSTFQPGAEPGDTDVVLQVQDRLPLRLYASIDNAGVASLGRAEWSVGANWGNAFGLDQQVSYQFSRAFSGLFDAHSVSWTVPLPWRDKLIVFGSYEEEKPNAGPAFDETGTSGQASLRYAHTLPQFAFANDIGFTEDIQVGFDFKTTNNNLEFGGTRVFASGVEVDQFPIVYEGTETDHHGQTTIENQLVISPGGLTNGNNSAAFRTAIAGSSADYVYDRIGLTRVTFLPADFSWVFRVIGQVADGNLQFSEQLGAGGASSVRGYYTDAAIGTQGVLVSNEIRGPAMSLSKLVGQHLPVDDQAQFGAFWDYGHVAQKDAVPDQVNSATLSSLGVDAHLTLNRYADLRVDVGWQLRAAPGSDGRSVFTDFAVTVGF